MRTVSTIREENIRLYFDGLQKDTHDRQGVGLRYKKWLDLRYRLWRLDDRQFHEACASIASILEQFEQKAQQDFADEAKAQQSKLTSEEQATLNQSNDPLFQGKNLAEPIAPVK